MNFTVKTFDELSTRELYEILRLRSEIFVVEQNCAYQDIDNKDYDSLHVFYESEGKVLAYLRVFMREEGVAQIGRVVTLKHGTGLGGKLLKEGIRLVREEFPAQSIFLEAQCYATGFYAREGFEICTEEFLEDGIPHVGMRLEL